MQQEEEEKDVKKMKEEILKILYAEDGGEEEDDGRNEGAGNREEEAKGDPEHGEEADSAESSGIQDVYIALMNQEVEDEKNKYVVRKKEA